MLPIYIHHNWKRYLDDIFTFWNKTADDLFKKNHAEINQLHESIELTMGGSEKELLF